MSFYKTGQSGAYAVMRTDVNGSGINVNTLADGSISNGELLHLSGLTENIQSAITEIRFQRELNAVTFEVRTADESNSISPNAALPFANLPEPTQLGGIDLGNMVVGDRVLIVKTWQPEENGIWIFNGSLSPMTRLDTYSDALTVIGSRIAVAEGTLKGRTYSNLNTQADLVTIDTDAITYRINNDLIMSSSTVSYNPSTGAVAYIGQLNSQSDVLISTPIIANVLMYNGTKWVNVALSSEATIDVTGAVTLSNSAVIEKILPNFIGQNYDNIAANDSIELAIEKLGAHLNRGVATFTTSDTIDVSSKVALVGADLLTITLPSASSVGSGFEFTIKNKAFYTTTINALSGNIDGAAAFVLTNTDSVKVISDGTNYYMI